MSSRSAMPDRGRWWWSYRSVIVVFWAVPAGALLIGYLTLPNHVASNCKEALFGCSVAPRDGTVLLAVFVYPLVAVAGLLVMGVIATGRAWRHRSLAGCHLTCPAESNSQKRRCSTRQPCRSGRCVTTALQG
jgi:hypothetical protein